MPDERELFTLSTAPKDLVKMTQTLHGALAMVEQLRGGMRARGMPGEICQLVDALIRGLPHQGYRSPEDFSVWRGRIENDTEFFTSPADFSYCPLEHAVGWGRCTRPGTTVFYSAINLNTIWAELYPMVGDRVHLGRAKKRDNVEFMVSEVGGIDYCRRFGRSMLAGEAGHSFFNDWLHSRTDEEALRASLVDAYFAHEFAETISRSRDYLIAATVSGLLLDAADVGGHFLLDGFSYPSVAHRGGVNFAIQPNSFDEKMKWQQFIVAEIVSTLGYGIYAYREIASAEIPADGDVLRWVPSE